MKRFKIQIASPRFISIISKNRNTILCKFHRYSCTGSLILIQRTFLGPASVVDCLWQRDNQHRFYERWENNWNINRIFTHSPFDSLAGTASNKLICKHSDSWWLETSRRFQFKCERIQFMRNCSAKEFSVLKAVELHFSEPLSSDDGWKLFNLTTVGGFYKCVWFNKIFYFLVHRSFRALF